jgi:hypothetical protein
MRVLLDKNIVRAALAGLRFGAQRPLLPLELSALAFWRAAEVRVPHYQLFIPYTTAHILRPMSRYAEVRLLLEATSVLWPGTYTRRWQRRVQATTGLTPEDAMILALGTFGTTTSGTIMGTPFVVTADQRLINGYQRHVGQLQARLSRMIAQLDQPFNQAILPKVLLPEAAGGEVLG